jgi:hypothetical protein
MKYILINKGKGQYGLNGDQVITAANLYKLEDSENTAPNLQEVSVIGNSTTLPITHADATLDTQSATLGQIKRYINDILLKDGTYLISGGVVQWAGSGYTYNISSAIASFSGTITDVQFDTVTLSPADLLNDRIDVITVTPTGFNVIEGIAASDPVEPQIENLDDEIKLTVVLVQAASSIPIDVDTDLIYNENIEWVISNSTGATFSADNIQFPFVGYKCISALNVNNNIFSITFTKDSNFDLNEYDSISFRIRLNETVVNAGSLRAIFQDVSNVATTNELTVSFNKTLVGQYQYVSFPISDFTILNTNSRKLVLSFRKGTPGNTAHQGFYIDDVKLQKGVTVTVPDPVIDFKQYVEEFTYQEGDPQTFTLQYPLIGWPTIFVNSTHYSKSLFSVADQTITFLAPLDDEDFVSISYFSKPFEVNPNYATQTELSNYVLNSTYNAEIANIYDQFKTPFQNAYVNQSAMIADQTNQIANYFYFTEGSHWVYLGTTNNNITDYREVKSNNLKLTAFSSNILTIGSFKSYIVQTGNISYTATITDPFINFGNTTEH